MQIQNLAFLLLFLPFVGCQQGPETAGIALSSFAAEQPAPKKTAPSATNIVFQSADGGQTWQDISNGLPKDLQPSTVFTLGNEVMLGTQNGLYRGSIGGSCNAAAAASAWTQEPFLGGRITDVFPGRAGLYACSYETGLFQTLPGAGFWVSNPLKEKMVLTVLETPDGNLFVTSDNGIYKSADGGQTWKHVFKDGIVLEIVASNGVLIGGGRHGVLRSTDAGENWDWALNENILAKKIGLAGGHFVAILGTEDPTKVAPEGITNRLRFSADGGQTWQRIDQSEAPLENMYSMDERLSDATDIYDIVQAGGYLFCSFDTGVFRSADQGKSWEPVLPADGKRVFRLGVAGQVLYAIAVFAGC